MFAGFIVIIAPAIVLKVAILDVRFAVIAKNYPSYK
jgi:hypothetical protein